MIKKFMYKSDDIITRIRGDFKICDPVLGTGLIKPFEVAGANHNHIQGRLKIQFHT